MSDPFDQAVARADRIIAETFNNVVVTVEGHPPFPAIFDVSPVEDQLSGGGRFVGKNERLSVQHPPDQSLTADQIITLMFKDGSTKQFKTRQPIPDDSGWLTVPLSEYHVQRITPLRY